MVNYCILCGSRRQKGISYHGFPKNLELRTKWLEFCGMEEHHLRSVSTICSSHFKDEDLISQLGKRIVKPNAIPSFFHLRKMKKKSKHQTLTDKSQEESGRDFIEKNFELNFDDDPAVKNAFSMGGNKEIPIGLSDNNNDPVVKNKDALTTNDRDATLRLDNNYDLVMEHDETLMTNSDEDTLPVPVEGASAVINVLKTPPKYVEPRFVGDIQSPHLATPRRAKRALNLAKSNIVQRRKIEVLQQANRRYRKRILHMKDLIKMLKQKNLVSDGAADSLLVSFDKINY
ncbi:uncharacterized protein [Linepithema humile]|uniref:uncharacterized protein n=1 Tax=Linepithema humile TaxID=83485 RepID=UPI00351F5153